MSYWYIDGKDGRHYCYAKEPTFLCPMGEPTEYVVPAPEGSETEGAHVLKDATKAAVTAAAEQLGMDPVLLGMIVKRGHSHRHGRRRVDGRLTDQCVACGARMERKGFRVWIEALPTEEDAQSRIADRLGFSGYRPVPGSSFYLDTKKEAAQWARDEAKLERMVRS